MPPTVEETTKRSGLIWVQVPGRRPQPVWHLWHEGAAYVVGGDGEQPTAGLEEADTARIGVRSKDTGARVLVWEARVEPVPVGSDAWTAVIPLLLAKRLNLVDAADAAQRWARDCRAFRLVPTGRITESADRPLTDSGAAPPAATPATTPVPRPFTFRRS